MGTKAEGATATTFVLLPPPLTRLVGWKCWGLLMVSLARNCHVPAQELLDMKKGAGRRWKRRDSDY